MKDSYIEKLFTAWQEAEANMHNILLNEPNLRQTYNSSPTQSMIQTANEIKNAEEYERIFQQYLEICNRAIEQNKNKFPYTEIWGARFKTLKTEATLQAIVYDDRPKAAFMLRLTKDMKIEIVEKKPVPEDEWPFTYQYLKRVVDNPKEYIDNPAKLEWGWLKTVFGSIV